MGKSWTKAPDELVEGNGLSSSGKVVLLALIRLARQNPGARPGARKVAEKAGLSRSHTQRAIQELARAGLVTYRFLGIGVPSVVELGSELQPERPLCYPATCPLAGMKMPAHGPVACPCAGSITPADGRPSSLETREMPERERETLSFSSASLQFREEMKEAHGYRLSDKQLAFIEPAFKGGAPLSLALELARGWSYPESPWEFASRLSKAWGEVAGVIRQVDGARELGQAVYLGGPQMAIVRRYGTPEQVAWAEGGRKAPVP